MFLYGTADAVGQESGGGKVTDKEYKFLSSLGEETLLFDRNVLTSKSMLGLNDPWDWDGKLLQLLESVSTIRLAHFYSGTFSNTVKYLRKGKAKIVYTVAAHSIEASRKEHEKFGIDYQNLYPHLCVPRLWERYSKGYFLSNVLVAPKG